MLAITTQSRVKDRLRAVAATLGLAAPQCIARSCELPAIAARDETALVVDLASCCHELRAAAAIREWASRNPDVAVILFVPLVDREGELRLLYELAAAGVGQMMTGSDFDRLEVWRNVVARETLSGLRSAMRADFLVAVERSGHALLAEEIVLRLLADTPQLTDVHLSIATYLGHPSARSDVCRRVASSFLRRAGQLPASRLLVLFRLAWCRFLMERGWSTRAIASFLGYRTPRELRLTLRRRLALHMREVAATPYGEVLATIARACGVPRPQTGTPATKEVPVETSWAK